MAYLERHPVESPWGLERITVLLAQGLALYASHNRDRKKRREPFALNDFLPGADEILIGSKPEQGFLAQLDAAILATKALGGEVTIDLDAARERAKTLDAEQAKA